MFVYLLILAVIILFVAGVFFVYQGYVVVPDPASVVARADFEKVREDFQASQKQEEELRLQLDHLTMDLEKVRGNMEDNQKLEQTIKDLELRQEGYQSQIHELQGNVQFLSGKADEQAVKALKAIQALDEETGKARRQAEEAKAQSQTVAQEDLQKLTSANAALQEQANAHLEKIAALQKQIEEAQGRSGEEQAEADKQMRQLRERHDALVNGVKTITQRIADIEGSFARRQQSYEGDLAAARQTIGRLMEEKARLEEDSREAGAVGQLEAQLEEIRRESESKLAAAEDRSSRLQTETNELRRQIGEYGRRIREMEEEARHKSAGTGDASPAGLSVLPGGRQAVPAAPQQAVRPGGRDENDLTAMLNRLKQTNARLQQREKILQQELTKSRAESAGLKKICEELEEQRERS